MNFVPKLEILGVGSWDYYGANSRMCTLDNAYAF